MSMELERLISRAEVWLGDPRLLARIIKLAIRNKSVRRFRSTCIDELDEVHFTSPELVQSHERVVAMCRLPPLVCE